MILSTLSISSHDFALGFSTRSHTNGISILIYKFRIFSKLVDVRLSLSIYYLFIFFLNYFNKFIIILILADQINSTILKKKVIFESYNLK